MAKFHRVRSALGQLQETHPQTSKQRVTGPSKATGTSEWLASFSSGGVRRHPRMQDVAHWFLAPVRQYSDTWS